MPGVLRIGSLESLQVAFDCVPVWRGDDEQLRRAGKIAGLTEGCGAATRKCEREREKERETGRESHSKQCMLRGFRILCLEPFRCGSYRTRKTRIVSSSKRGWPAWKRPTSEKMASAICAAGR